MRAPLDFNVINNQLLNLGAVNSAAELQGLLCGKLCGAAQLDYPAWRKQAIAFLGLEYLELSDEQQTLFDTLLDQCQVQLNDPNFGFTPLLPDDDSSLTRRTEELALWCAGFLHGVGSSGLSGEAKLSDEVAGALRDLAQISQADAGDEEQDADETAMFELIEYVKVAALTIYNELAQDPAEPAGATLH